MYLYFSSFCNKFACYTQMKKTLVTPLFHFNNSFSLHLLYFVVISIIGFLSLKVSKTRTNERLGNLDLFYTSVSATTTSSMTAVEMEVFSNVQLVVMSILILLGGEVFTSMLGLFIRRLESSRENNSIELGIIMNPTFFRGDQNDDHEVSINTQKNSINFLGYVVLGYFIIVHFIGSSVLTMYVSLTPSALNVLKNKGLVLHTFSFFMVVSTFSSCGFAPTNENMMVFRKNNPGLLLILVPYVFLGNTLYPACLRLVVWVLERVTRKKEFKYLLNNYKELGYGHLMSRRECWLLGSTTIAFLVLQFAVFCGMEWSSGVMEGMNTYQKFVGSLFQTANVRHSGESIVDMSQLSHAVLVLFIIMMYLPSYFSFLPIGDQQQEAITEEDKAMRKQKKKSVIENILFSQLTYLVVFVIVICITERKNLKEDPLNFSVLNIVFEVISAYGNVGLSTGYSCERRLKADGFCEDKWFGFSAKWSNEGKIALIIVMFFGRLKSFNMNGGKAWKIL